VTRAGSRPQELDARVRALREEVKKTRKEFDKTEDDLKALQSVGQIIGEVLRQLDDERCACPPRRSAPLTAALRAAPCADARAACAHTAVIVKASSGPRYVVGCRTKLDKSKLTQGTRVALDMTTLTIMRALPREVRAQGRGGTLRRAGQPCVAERARALRPADAAARAYRRWTPSSTTCCTKTRGRHAPRRGARARSALHTCSHRRARVAPRATRG
jgi:hypothetical protein